MPEQDFVVPMVNPVVAEVRYVVEPEEELDSKSGVCACAEIVVVVELDLVALVTLPDRADPVSNCSRPCRQGYPK